MRPIHRAVVVGRDITQGLGLPGVLRGGGGFVEYGFERLRSRDSLISGLP
jgi:hypothetical protein